MPTGPNPRREPTGSRSSQGEPRAILPATHEYEAWRPMKRRKFGGGRTAIKNPDSGAVTASTVKDCLGETASELTEIRGFEGLPIVGETAPPLYNHPMAASPRLKSSQQALKFSPEIRRADLRADLSTLRSWANEAVDRRGYGGARMLANDAGIPEVALSRFRTGKNLPDQYRIPLQEACARLLPFNQRSAA